LRAARAFVSIPRMPWFERDDVRIHYEEYGQGSPVLLFAPGGMRSSIEVWGRAPWNPIAELVSGSGTAPAGGTAPALRGGGSSFRVIAMDQRNAGQSSATVAATDGWHSYANDHVALLDHLGIERCGLLGGCIGSSFCLGLIEAAPERVSAAVLQNPIGLYENREMFYSFFDDWAAELRKKQPGLAATGWSAFRERMYGGDFVFNVSRDFVRQCAVPLLILEGSDPYHPTPISREIAALAPSAELIAGWKEPAQLPAVIERVRAFLASHSR
jgi:pimeloyl-ACP methyl ester carboxylesterase